MFFESQINKLKHFRNSLDFNSLMEEVFSKKEIKELINELNKNQLSKGVDGNNDAIEGRNIGLAGEYSEVTKELRRAEGLQVAVIDLNFTGEFYKSIAVIVGNSYFEIIADPLKDDTDLFSEFGEDIIKLTDESIEKLAIAVKEETEKVIIRLYNELTS